MKNETLKVSEEMVRSTAGFGPVPVWKRVLDVGCILLALPVLLPVVVALAAVIKCVSSGPILFLQERVGHHGRRFICFKFRTMKVNADPGIHQRHLADLVQSNAPMAKMDAKGDPRLISLGSLLRATGLDELPQLLNVLGGQMSLVGPRPCVPYEFEHYLPSQKRRFDTLPGLTGLWQVSGKNKTTFAEMIALDIHYTENKSPWLDLKIMFRTLPALVTQVREARAKRSEIGSPARRQSSRQRDPIPIWKVSAWWFSRDGEHTEKAAINASSACPDDRGCSAGPFTRLSLPAETTYARHAVRER